MVETGAKFISAADAYAVFRVTRAWLREGAEQGRIRKTGMTVKNRILGKECVKYLYSVDDIERELDEWATRSQVRRAIKRGGC